MKKTECTPEQWAAIRQYQRDYYRKNHEIVREQKRTQYARRIHKEHERQRKYRLKPGNVEHRRLLDAKPQAIARRLAYQQTPEAKARAKQRMKERFDADPELQSRFNNYGRFLKTGFTPELFMQLRKAQNNRCAICKNEFSEENRPHADHCHDRNEPRGLLCFQCNIIDGKLLKIGVEPVEFGRLLQEYRLTPPAKLLAC